GVAVGDVNAEAVPEVLVPIVQVGPSGARVPAPGFARGHLCPTSSCSPVPGRVSEACDFERGSFTSAGSGVRCSVGGWTSRPPVRLGKLIVGAHEDGSRSLADACA